MNRRSLPPLLDWESLTKAAECLRVLSHPVRLRMVQLMLHDRYTVGELAEASEISQPMASVPVLVKGGRVWYEDPANAGQILSISYEEAGIHAEPSHPFSVDHNVLPSESAIGAVSCNECHLSDFIDDSPDVVTESPFFDRAILVDPFGPDGAATPIYETIREVANVDPP